MLSRWITIALVLGACSSSAGHVDVIAFSTRDPGPKADLLVVFEDPDGSTRTAQTDGDGHASGDIVAGGTVWVEDVAPYNTPGYITARTNVHPGDTIEIGPRGAAIHAPRGTMQLSGAIPPGANGLGIASNCSGTSGPPMTVTFDDRCQTTADVLILGLDVVGGVSGTELVGYISLPSQPIIDGGTITLDPTAWQSPETVTLSFVHGGATVDYAVANALWEGGSPSAPIVPVGTLVARGTTNGSTFQMTFPASSATSPIDLAAVLPPAVSTEHDPNGDLRWTTDGNTAPTADVLVTQYTWLYQTDPNIQLNMALLIISDPETDGVIPALNMPAPMSTYLPNDGFPIPSGTGQFFRFNGFGDADPKRMAEFESIEPWLNVATTPTWSIASTNIQ